MRKGPAINVVDTTFETTLVLVPKREDRGNQWYPRNPRMTL